LCLICSGFFPWPTEPRRKFVCVPDSASRGSLGVMRIDRRQPSALLAKILWLPALVPCEARWPDPMFHVRYTDGTTSLHACTGEWSSRRSWSKAERRCAENGPTMMRGRHHSACEGNPGFQDNCSEHSGGEGGAVVVKVLPPRGPASLRTEWFEVGRKQAWMSPSRNPTRSQQTYGRDLRQRPCGAPSPGGKKGCEEGLKCGSKSGVQIEEIGTILPKLSEPGRGPRTGAQLAERSGMEVRGRGGPPIAFRRGVGNDGIDFRSECHRQF